MKVKALISKMNDHGTRPRVRVMKRTDGATILVYEGSPANADETIRDLSVITFTVLGHGFLEINAQ